VALEYYPIIIKEARTVIFRKLNKNEIDYFTTKAYYFIALLNIIRKILKKIMVTRLSEAAEAYKLLPE
jgi:hypothetical protein